MKTKCLGSRSLRPLPFLVCLLFCLQAPSVFAAPATGHPRLWIREADLPRLRSWAVDSNLIYAEGLAQLLDFAKTQMDQVNSNNIPPSPNVPNADTGGRGYETYPTEMYAELFAFLSLIHPDPAERDALAQRARFLLMYLVNEAIKGPDLGDPPARFRDPIFYTADSNRARWYGEAFGLTVDWIYPYLTAADKSAIRTVFLRWADEIVHSAYPKPPEPPGLLNDPALRAPSLWYGSPFNPVRWAGNNHFTSNMRNLGLMAMSFDPANDPDGKLRGYLANATGAFLYLVDHLLRNDSRGGLLPEGFEYGPQTGAYITQFLLALRTSGQDDPNVWGPQVVLENNPFWGQFIPAYLHSLSPVTVIDPDEQWRGPLWFAAWFGDGQQTVAPDFIAAIGPLAVYNYLDGNSRTLSEMRWIQTYLPPGGRDGLNDRLRDGDVFSNPIFYFLLFDPAAGPPVDPRPAQSLTFFAPGLGRLLARTSWDSNATWFTYILTWNTIDHQNADGNQIEFYRRGEWLTKERTGWGLDAGSSDNHNTLAIENNPPDHNTPGEDRNILWQRGSQWVYHTPEDGDPGVMATSFSDEFVYLLGDATALYRSVGENSTDVLHASRSVCWLKPDHLIIYDRAATATPNRFKRFWLNFANNPAVAGNLTTVTLNSGQQVFVTTLLPANAAISSETAPDALTGSVANFQSMKFRLRVEAPDGPKEARFLNVIQGADPGAAPAPVTLLQSVSGVSFSGVLVRDTAIFFPENLDTPFTGFTYVVPFSTTAHLITGLAPDLGYRVNAQQVGKDLSVTISPGGDAVTDRGGLLHLRPGRQPILSVTCLPNGTIRLQFIEFPGRAYTIQASSDLTQWTDLGTPIQSADGLFQFDDTTAASFHWRFYRKLAK